MITTKGNFKTASDAFDYFYVKIKNKGLEFGDTKALFNVGFYIHNPLDKNIKAEVINLRTLRPLDIDTIIESVKKTNRVVTCEEGFPFSGIGAEISALITEKAFDWLDAPVKRVTGKDVPMPYAANLEKLALPQVDDIVSACTEVCYED